MKIVFLQFNPKFRCVAENVDRALSMISTVDFDLPVLPELFNIGYLFSVVMKFINLQRSSQWICM